MITVKYGDHTEEFPNPPTPLHLQTAIRIGMRRMRERHDGLSVPRAFHIKLDGRRMHPKDSEVIVPDNSTIELELADGEHDLDTKLFVLDL